MEKKNKKRRFFVNRWINKIRKWKVLFQISDWVYEIFSSTKEFSVAFKNLFYQKEIGELFGSRNGNFYKIVLLYLILFLSVGFGIQSKSFFNKQLDNPFVRYIPIPITGDASLDTETIIDSLVSHYKGAEIKRKVKLDTIQSFSANNALRFTSDYVENEFVGIGIDFDSDLLTNAVFNKDNEVIGEPFSNVEQRSIVVTLNMLKDLYLVESDKTLEELTAEDLPGYIMFQPGGYSFEVPVIIKAVAEQLPWENDFVLPSKFNDHLFFNAGFLYFDKFSDQVSFYISQISDIEKLNGTLVDFATSNGIPTDSSSLRLVKTEGIDNSVLVSFSENSGASFYETEIKEKLKSAFGVADTNFVDAYYKFYDQPGKDYSCRAQQSGIFVVFDNLRKVQDFNTDLKKYSSEVITDLIAPGSTRKLKGLELEMSSINLRLILNIIEIIVMAFLIIIGVLALTSLISIIRVLFEMYFQRIEKNIGTFMAFGINIKVVYVVMLNVFTFLSLIVGIVLAFAIGEILEKGIIFILGNALGEEVKLFSLLNWITPFVLISVGLANWWAFKRASRIFAEWPGDIINDRKSFD